MVTISTLLALAAFSSWGALPTIERPTVIDRTRLERTHLTPEQPQRRTPPPARSTFWVDGKDLRDPCGDVVVMRGVNHPTIYVDRAGAAMPEIAQTGANAVRLFWFATHDIPIEEAEASVSAAWANGMLPMLEMHDSTGTWNLDPIVDYWTAPATVAFIQRHEGHLLVNLANEASISDRDTFEADTIAAIQRMRDAGIRVPIVIDATGWGRNYDVLLERGPAILAADPLHNTMFSAHWYDPTSTAEVTEVLETAVAMDLPFLIGEFANKSPPGCGPALPYLHLIRESERLGISWLAWSWGNTDASTWWNGDCWEFDMTTTLDADTLERWGREVAVTDTASIAATSAHTPWFAGRCE